MMQKITLLPLFLLLLSCEKSSESKYELLQSSEWILGKWEYKNTDGILTENWTKINDSVYKGTSYFVKGKDTIHKEAIVLNQIGESLTYKTVIKGQNADLPILFLAKETVENQLVFENLNNDYPQKIKYTKGNPSQITTEITGKQFEKTTTEKYNLKKVK
ncbi:DUF6265 family protein [Flavobacterium algicola]|uniref:DUF6265 family protein n=1 Tax=Flavobacterium algicola TaxID=556529 RepID=UPI001EFE5CBC|nr:DUF6265 family protein [Flavobacterium algicola]MCG9792541.1 DUF6265 family protein [Flavobacterium algicola]